MSVKEAAAHYKWAGALLKEGGEAAFENGNLRPQCRPRWLAVERVATMAALPRMRVSSPAIALAFSLALVLRKQ